MSKSAWQLLGDYLKDTQLLGSIQSTLYWDQNTSMPIAGSTWRGEQLSLLAKQLHARQSSEQFEILIEEAKSELQNLKEKDGFESELMTDRFKILSCLSKISIDKKDWILNWLLSLQQQSLMVICVGRKLGKIMTSKVFLQLSRN